MGVKITYAIELIKKWAVKYLSSVSLHFNVFICQQTVFPIKKPITSRA